MRPIDPTTHDLLARAGQWILERFGRDDNITGVGVGYRRRAGKACDEPVVTVMVKKKRRPSLISRRRMIPSQIEIDGRACATDVLQAQAVVFAADNTPPVMPYKFRPLMFGCGISNESDAAPDAGTLGCFVRDNTDNKVCILTANHVIADNNTAPLNDPVVQPAALDDPTGVPLNEVAKLKRFVPIVGGATTVDAAIAEINTGVPVLGTYGGVSVGAPTANKPAVGMVVAGDGYGNVWMTRMSSTLTAIDATLLPTPTSGTNVMASNPALLTRIEKGGRTTGYTSSRVYGTGKSVDVTVPGQGVVTYSDLIWTQWFAWAGDSGSMAIKKGDPTAIDDGDDLNSRDQIAAMIKDKFDPCEVLDTIQFAYDIPITDDEALSDDVRDEFMSQSYTGRFLITLCYLNTQLVKDRLDEPQDPGVQDYAQTLYDEYQPRIADIMTNPSSTELLTPDDGDAYSYLLTVLEGSGVLDSNEAAVAESLKTLHGPNMQYMNRAQVMAYMDQPDVLQSLISAVEAMPALEMVGEAKALGGLE